MTPEPEELLDQCIEHMRTGGDPEDILRQHPDLADEVRPLLGLTSELAGLPDPRPSMPTLMRTLTRLALRRPTSRRALMRAAAVFLCVCLAGWGAVAASANALPGDWLYSVKLLTERAQFFLTVNNEAKAELRIAFSEQRLTEMVRNYERGGGIDKQLLREMLDEAQDALDISPTLPEARRGLFLSRVAYLSDFQKSTLERLKERVGEEEQQELTRVIDACGKRCEQMCRMMGCGGGAQRQWTCTCPKCP
jgi:uncharacterized protein DUF5667